MAICCKEIDFFPKIKFTCSFNLINLFKIYSSDIQCSEFRVMFGVLKAAQKPLQKQPASVW